MELIVQILGVAAAVLGITDSVISIRRARQRGTPAPRRWVWFTAYLVMLLVTVGVIGLNEYRQWHPSGLLMTKVDLTPDKHYITLEQTQSFYRGWSFTGLEQKLRRRFYANDAPPESRPAGISLTHVSTGSRLTQQPPRVVGEIDHPLKRGEQHHLFIHAENAAIAKITSPSRWWDCAGWTGLNFNAGDNEPQKLRELLVVVDFSALRSKGTCTGVFAPNGTPRHYFITPDMRSDAKKLSPPADVGTNLCGAFTPLQAADDKEQCVWWARINGLAVGELPVRWKFADSVSN